MNGWCNKENPGERFPLSADVRSTPNFLPSLNYPHYAEKHSPNSIYYCQDASTLGSKRVMRERVNKEKSLHGSPRAYNNLPISGHFKWTWMIELKYGKDTDKKRRRWKWGWSLFFFLSSDNSFPWDFADLSIMRLSTAPSLSLSVAHPLSSSDSHHPRCPSGCVINGFLSRLGYRWDSRLGP